LLDFNIALLQGVTIGGNTVLHIANTSKFARAVDRKDSSLLWKRNKLDETPLHCAAKAGNSDMVSCLIELAKNDETFLKAENKHGE
jgi:ankyrin repeat protein